MKVNFTYMFKNMATANQHQKCTVSVGMALTQTSQIRSQTSDDQSSPYCAYQTYSVLTALHPAHYVAAAVSAHSECGTQAEQQRMNHYIRHYTGLDTMHIQYVVAQTCMYRMYVQTHENT